MGRVHNSQICEATGVSRDYWNEYFHRPIYSMRDFSFEANLRSLQESPVKRYTERYSDEVYSNVITFKNRERVARLDEIADEVNIIATPETFSIDTFRDLICEVYKLIIGKPFELKPGPSE
jgi:hypothetical protein